MIGKDFLVFLNSIVKYRNKFSLSFFLILFCAHFSLAQLDTKIDRDHIKIGEEIHYSLSVPISSSTNLKLPQLKDTLSFHIEILDQKVDTIFENEQKLIVQKLTLTSYDAGEFLIRSLPVIIDSDTLLSHSFQIKVDDVEIDSANLQGFTIKPIMEEEFTWKDYWNQYRNYILGGILLIVLFLVLWMFLKRKKESRKIIPLKSPKEEAKDALKKLDKKKYLEKSAVNPYYSELSYIIRRYLGRVYEFSSLELLSDDLVEHIKKHTPLEKEEVEKLKQFLFDSDLVKFAKSIPEENKHVFYRKWADELIEKAKPIVIETEEDKNNPKIQKK